jgi:hypothetical protein
MEPKQIADIRDNLKKLYNEIMAVKTVEDFTRNRFMIAVNDEINANISPENLGKVLASIHVNLSEFGLKLALDEKIHVAFAKRIDQIHEFSMKHFKNESYLIRVLEIEPMSINVFI